jgi:putative transposase
MGAIKSMSRKANCWDNAVAESFFASLKGEKLDHEKYETRGQAHAAIDDYIEHFYNTLRRHSTIGYVSPVEFEMRFMQRECSA